jgi:16S rRNA (uracil1498-N3)-methyltransferase
MHRFFLPPSWVQGNKVTVTGPQAHQIARVLRMRTGDVIVVLDNSGWEIETRLTAVDRSLVEGEVLHRRLAGGEPRIKISIYQGMLKSNRFEFVLQKCTELGVVEFVPVISDRCVISDLDAVDRKRHRWEWIIQEASEQSRRARKPALRSPMLFLQACEVARHSRALSLLPWEGEDQVTLSEVLRNAPAGFEDRWPPLSVGLFIGPEGGFTGDEAVTAQRYGIVPVTLGARILRSETAGLVAAAAILYEAGDLG